MYRITAPSRTSLSHREEYLLQPHCRRKASQGSRRPCPTTDRQTDRSPGGGGGLTRPFEEELLELGSLVGDGLLGEVRPQGEQREIHHVLLHQLQHPQHLPVEEQEEEETEEEQEDEQEQKEGGEEPSRRK